MTVPLLPAGSRVLVAGGSGFIGDQPRGVRESQRLDRQKHRPIASSQPRTPAMRRKIDPSIASERRRGGGSVRTRYVVHLGARTDLGDNTLAEHASNTWGLEALIESLTAGPRVKGVVFASSRLVCRIGHQPTSDEDYCPTTAYGASKAEGERIVRRAGLAVPWIIVRPTSTWGLGSASRTGPSSRYAFRGSQGVGG